MKLVLIGNGGYLYSIKEPKEKDTYNDKLEALLCLKNEIGKIIKEKINILRKFEFKLKNIDSYEEIFKEQYFNINYDF